LLGNIKQKHMIELVASDQQRQFGLNKRNSLPRYCRECEVRFACHGECPKNRFIETPDGEPGLNYLCAGYKAFFIHVDKPMRAMAKLLRRNRAPAEVMLAPAAEDAQLQKAFAKAGRNEPCSNRVPASLRERTVHEVSVERHERKLHNNHRLTCFACLEAHRRSVV
jgi:uncharacterized protein